MPKEFHQHEWDDQIEDDCRHLVRLAIREDLARQQDWTTVALVPIDACGTADVVARQAGVVAGLRAIPILLGEMDANVAWTAATSDGDRVEAATVVGQLVGSARDLLTSERPLLNLLSRLSGIASLTAQYVATVSSTKARIYDTRKTLPGWRRLEKYAVRCGGGFNHRTGLFDAVMIKDNHLAFLESGRGDDGDSPTGAAAAVGRVRGFLQAMRGEVELSEKVIEVEVDTLAQLGDALAAHPDIVLLDNMDLDSLREAVAMRDAAAVDVELEASGGVTLKTIGLIAATGVDRISVGALTHSATCFDMGLDWRKA